MVRPTFRMWSWARAEGGALEIMPNERQPGRRRISGCQLQRAPAWHHPSAQRAGSRLTIFVTIVARHVTIRRATETTRPREPFS